MIIPVYNTERYLRDTLDSVLRQTLSSIEVICVDDGSTDGSGKILDEYAGKDRRVRVFHEENRSAGAARNYGLSKASGRYVVFWDADDEFRKDALEVLYLRCRKLKADICVCTARRRDDETGEVYASGAYLNRKLVPKEPVFNRKVIPQYIFNFASNVPWNKMYRRTFLIKNGLHFQEIRQANDVWFSMTALYCAERICTVKEPLVIYRVENTKSLTGKAAVNDMCVVDALREVRRSLEEYLGSEETSDDTARKIWQSFINRAADALLFFLRKQWNAEVYRELFDRYREEVFPEFGLFDHPAEYYYNPEQYEDILQIKQLDAQQFLLYQFRRYERKYQIRAGMTPESYMRKAAGRLLRRR